MTDVWVIIELSLRLLTAIALGGAIGLERQWRLRTAGIRTNALVAVGAALFVIVGAVGFGGATADPTRVAAQVVSGIGFLGAGVILRDGFNIRGLTTAATLWCAAAIGSLAGAGMGWMSLIGAVGIIATNILLRPVGRYVSKRTPTPTSDSTDPLGPEYGYSLEVQTDRAAESRVRAVMLHAVGVDALSVRSLEASPKKADRMRITVHFASPSADHAPVFEHAVERISLDPEVASIRWWLTEPDSDDD